MQNFLIFLFLNTFSFVALGQKVQSKKKVDVVQRVQKLTWNLFVEQVSDAFSSTGQLGSEQSVLARKVIWQELYLYYKTMETVVLNDVFNSQRTHVEKEIYHASDRRLTNLATSSDLSAHVHIAAMELMLLHEELSAAPNAPKKSVPASELRKSMALRLSIHKINENSSEVFDQFRSVMKDLDGEKATGFILWLREKTKSFQKQNYVFLTKLQKSEAKDFKIYLATIDRELQKPVENFKNQKRVNSFLLTSKVILRAALYWGAFYQLEKYLSDKDYYANELILPFQRNNKITGITPQLLFNLYGYAMLLIPLHESSHSLVANILGDSTAVSDQLVGADPLPWVERNPISFGVLPIVTLGMLASANIPVNGAWEKKYPLKGTIVSLAGPFSNFLQGGAALLINKTKYKSQHLQNFALLNFTVGLLNLFPAFGSDGDQAIKGVMTWNEERYKKRKLLKDLSEKFHKNL